MLLKALREGLGRVIVFINFITRPKRLQRSAAGQQAAESAAKNLSLYQFYACPFCIRTRRVIHRLNIPLELRDAQKNQHNRAELLAGGGEIKVPCLRIEEDGETRWLYESPRIIDYLNSRFDPDKDTDGETVRQAS